MYALYFIGAVLVIRVVLEILAVRVGNKAATARISALNALPTFEEYVANHPDCETSSGVACYRCKSRNVLAWDLAGRDAGGPTKHSCRACGLELWRS